MARMGGKNGWHYELGRINMAVTDADILGWLNANPGADDTLIANTMRDAGVDPSRMAQVTGLDYGNVAQRYETALAPLSAVTQGNNTVLEDTGIPDYVTQRLNVGAPPTTTINFNNSVDTSPVVQPTVSSPLSNNSYFQANPDVASAYSNYSSQYTPQEFADFHYNNYGVNEGRVAPVESSVSSPLTPVVTQQAPLATNATSTAPTTINDLYQQVLGRPPESQAVIDEWKQQFGDTIEPTEVDQFKDAAQLELTNPTLTNLKGQILASSNTSVWQGEGYGSAQKNAEDMAKILSGIGITDIKDFGQITKQVPTYSYDQDGNQTQTGTETVTTYGNK
jgi:hypothetical protein